MNSDEDRFDQIKDHFNEEADTFDAIIKARVPFYEIFMEALVNVLPFKKDKAIKVADLGCGNGAVSFAVKEKFPNARITCVDFSAEMLQAARKKLSGHQNIDFIESDILKFNLSGFDAVLTSLCLHHIGEEKEKLTYFRKVHDGLLSGGVFYIYDVVLGSNDHLQKVNIIQWQKFMSLNLSEEDVEKTMSIYHNEDRPFPLMQELKRLKEAGFKDVDVICKYYNGAVYGGLK
jgi:tRNA (cmo5U34)-methyltransferase